MNIRGVQNGPNHYSVTIGNVELYFSYNTLIGFRAGKAQGRRENVWGRTTGKHMTAFNITGFLVMTESEITKAVQIAIAKDVKGE